MTGTGTGVAVSIHLHDRSAISVANRAGREGGRYSRIMFSPAVCLYLETAGQCDMLIAAACEAKTHLAGSGGATVIGQAPRLDGSIPDPDPGGCLCEGDQWDKYCPVHGSHDASDRWLKTQRENITTIGGVL